MTGNQAEKFAAQFLQAYRRRVDRHVDSPAALAWFRNDGASTLDLVKNSDSVLREAVREWCRAFESRPTDVAQGEWYTVDVTGYADLNDQGKTGWSHTKTVPLILVEHENDEKVEEEMWKLTYYRAVLKVLIFYDWTDTARSASPTKQRWLPEKLQRLGDVLKSSQDLLPERESEYLLLVGCGTEPEEFAVRWRAFRWAGAAFVEEQWCGELVRWQGSAR